MLSPRQTGTDTNGCTRHVPDQAQALTRSQGETHRERHGGLLPAHQRAFATLVLII